MTEPVQPPELVAVPPYPALGSSTFNVDAYNYGTAMPSVSFNIHQIGQSAYTNAVSAKEKALAAAQSAEAAAQSAAAADQSAQDATSNGAQQVTLAAQQVTLATQRAQDAETARAAAVVAKNAAEAALDSFDDRYLGAKASDPTTDNDGNSLVVGALYFRTGVGMQAWNGTAWVASYLTLEDVLAKTGGKLTGALEWATPVDVASAATTNIGAAASNRVRITGTTTITSLGSIAAGACRTVTFAGALTLTHNATSLILPGGANIVTAAGDVAEFESLGAGNWRCTGYQKANGQAVVSPTMPTLQGLNRGAYLRETNNGTLVTNGRYGIWTGGGAITMSMPTLANCANGDEILLGNLHHTWGSAAFTINCPANVVLKSPAGANDSQLVCNTNDLQGIRLYCVWNDGSQATWNVLF